MSQDDIHMATKHVGRCSTSLVIRKIEIKTKRRCHFTLVRMARIKKKISVDEKVEKLEPLYFASGDVKWRKTV